MGRRIFQIRLLPPYPHLQVRTARVQREHISIRRSPHRIFRPQRRAFGTCALYDGHKTPHGSYVSGLDANQGAITYNNIEVDEDGEYVLTINIKKKGQYEKYLVAKVNDSEEYEINFPPQKHYNVTARFQVVVRLKQGKNTIRLFNPVTSKADSEMYQYLRMGKALKDATARVAKERNEKEKPIVFSICEWGWANRTTGARKQAICGVRLPTSVPGGLG